MEKGLKVTFYTVLGIFFFGVVYLTTVMYLSPRRDIKERGFIACTKQLVLALQNCPAGKIGCPFKLLVKDMTCNVKVVARGAVDWVLGKQSTPWANYLFEPMLVSEETEDEVAKRSKRHQERLELDAQSQFIKQKQQELEEAKHRQLNIQVDELMQHPDALPDMRFLPEEKDADDNVPQGNIDAEADTRIELLATEKANSEIVTQSQNPIQKINNATEKKLKKGILKNEK